MDEELFNEQQYVVFKLGGEVFGLKINKVKEIVVYQETTHVPGLNSQIEGIINLRGNVIPIFNLSEKLGFPEPERNRHTRIVVIESHDNIVGLVVDGVSEVLMIQGKLIEKPSSIITAGIDTDYITGIAKIEEKLVILLDMEKIITPRVALAV